MADAQRVEPIVRRSLHWIAAAVVIAASLAADRILGFASDGGTRQAVQSWATAGGFVLAALAYVPSARMRAASTVLCLVIISTAAALAATHTSPRTARASWRTSSRETSPRQWGRTERTNPRS
jgi:hypothetical protein